MSVREKVQITVIEEYGKLLDTGLRVSTIHKEEIVYKNVL